MVGDVQITAGCRQRQRVRRFDIFREMKVSGNDGKMSSCFPVIVSVNSWVFQCLGLSLDWPSAPDRRSGLFAATPHQKHHGPARNLCQIRSHRNRAGLSSGSSTLSFRLYKKRSTGAGLVGMGLGWLGRCSSTPACGELQLIYDRTAQILGLAAPTSHFYNVFCGIPIWKNEGKHIQTN